MSQGFSRVGLTMLPCVHLAPITEIFLSDVSGFKEEQNHTVPEIGQTPSVRTLTAVPYLFPSITSGFSG